MRSVLTGALLGLLALGACAPVVDQAADKSPAETPAAPERRLTLTAASYDDLPGWRADSAAEVLPALLKSCARLLTQPETRPVGRNGLGGVIADWHGPCAAAQRLPPNDHAAVRSYFETWFQPYRAANNGNPEGLFTGYYEAELRGALAPDSRHRWPIWGLPEDLVQADLGAFDPALAGRRLVGRVDSGRFQPYPDRAQIEAGAIKGKAQPILWVDDPVDSFILHIQGSGRVVLPDGKTLRLGYAGNNGHGFVGIGRVMLDRNLLPPGQSSMQHIRAWLRANPDKATELMNENPRYIFFRRIDGDGPIGSQGVALTAMRSMAVDPDFVPLGTPLWLDTEHPRNGPRLQRLMIAQDTGSAIKGPVRGDFFWGTGEAALDDAGRMRSRGGYWLLLPKHRTAQVAAE